MELQERTQIDDMVKDMKESFLAMLYCFLDEIAISHNQIQEWMWILYVLEYRERVDSLEVAKTIKDILCNMRDYMENVARQRLRQSEPTQTSFEIDNSLLDFSLDGVIMRDNSDVLMMEEDSDSVIIEEDSNNNEQVDVLFYEDEILEE